MKRGTIFASRWSLVALCTAFASAAAPEESKPEGEHAKAKAPHEGKPSKDSPASKDSSASKDSNDDGKSAQREAQSKEPQSSIRAEHVKLLQSLGKSAGTEKLELTLVDRTPQLQARVMYAVARQDVERAREMYCSAGDAVIAKFDSNDSAEENLRRMERELAAQLPEARKQGCLSHVAREKVYSVDVDVDQIAEARRAAFVEAAQQAVKEGKVERFLQPPLHPGAFHFEFEH